MRHTEPNPTFEPIPIPTNPDNQNKEGLSTMPQTATNGQPDAMSSTDKDTQNPTQTILVEEQSAPRTPDTHSSRKRKRAGTDDRNSEKNARDCRSMQFEGMSLSQEATDVAITGWNSFGVAKDKAIEQMFDRALANCRSSIHSIRSKALFSSAPEKRGTLRTCLETNGMNDNLCHLEAAYFNIKIDLSETRESIRAMGISASEARAELHKFIRGLDCLLKPEEEERLQNIMSLLTTLQQVASGDA